MSARLYWRCAASARNSAPWQYTTHAALLLIVLLSQGCASQPPPVFWENPSNPYARVPPTKYHSVLRGYTRQRPIEPVPWTDRQNGGASGPARNGK